MGWKKEDTKVALQYATIRAKKLIPKQEAVVEHRKREILEYLRNHKDELAQIKVEMYIRDRRIYEGIQVLHIYLEQMLARLDYLDTRKTIPADMMDCISGIVFCTGKVEIEYLKDLTRQIERQFGQQFVKDVFSGAPGHVNERLRLKFSVEPPKRDVVIRELEKIASEGNVPFDSASALAEAWRAEEEKQPAPPPQPAQPSLPPSSNPAPPQFNALPPVPSDPLPDLAFPATQPYLPATPQYTPTPSQPDMRHHPYVTPTDLSPDPTFINSPAIGAAPVQPPQPAQPLLPPSSFPPSFPQTLQPPPFSTPENKTSPPPPFVADTLPSSFPAGYSEPKPAPSAPSAPAPSPDDSIDDLLQRRLDALLSGGGGAPQ